MGQATELANLPTYPIPILSNTLFRRFQAAGQIQIDPFAPQLLGPTAYRLRAYRVRYHRDEGDGVLEIGTFPLDERAYVLQPKEYVVISIREQIRLADGLVGTCFPASHCIEKGLIVTAGRIDSRYGHAIVFGVQNASDTEVPLTPELQIARLSVGWLGSENMPDYENVPGPAAYIEKVEQLRRTEADLREVSQSPTEGTAHPSGKKQR